MEDAPPPFDAIYEHAGFVRAMAVGVLGGDTEVEDVVQETWLVAMRAGPRRSASLRSWLGSVSRRLALRSRRSAARRDAKHGRGARPEGTPSVADLAAREEVRRILVQAVLALDEPYRAAILLRYVEGLPLREIAERQGDPVETVKTRLRRGLERLRERLDAEHRGDRKAWASALVPFVAPMAPVTAAVPGLVTVAFLAFAATGALAAWQGWGPFAPEVDRSDLLLGKVRSSIDLWKKGALRPAEPEPSGLAARPSAGRGAISGVVRQGWDPVAGARVEVRAPVGGASIDLWASWTLRRWLAPWLASRTIGVATTDAAGRYRVLGVGTGLHQVVAFAPDGQTGTTVAWVPTEGGFVGRDVEVSPHREGLSGRITRADGTPWTGLVMAHRADLAWSAFALPPEAGPVRTDADGRFRIAGLDEGAWVLVGVDPGVELILDRPRPVPAAGDVEWTIASSGADRTLRVLADDDGSPIAGAEVIWATQSGEGEYFGRIRRLVADAAGVVVVPAAAREGLRAQAPGFVPRDVSRERSDQPPAVEIRLARGARITGRVTMADGAPSPGARVRFEPLDDVGNHGEGGEAVTDGGGRYEINDLGALEGVLWVAGESVYTLRAPLGASNDADLPVVSLHAGETRTKDFVALFAPRVEGRVTRADGTPVAGAVVELSLPAETRRSRGPRRNSSTATDASGAYAVVVPWPAVGSRVTVVAEDESRGVGVVQTSADGTARADVVLGDPDPRRLEVRVKEEGHGRPVAGARVSAYTKSSDLFVQGQLSEAVTDAGGVAYLTRLPSGPLTVSVPPPPTASKGEPIQRVAPCEGPGLCRVTIEIPAPSPRAKSASLERGPVAAAPTANAAPVVRIVGPDGSPVPAGQLVAYLFLGVQRPGARYAGSGSFTNGRAQGRGDPGATVYYEAFGAETVGKTPLPYGAVLAGPFGPDDGEVVLRMPPERTIEGRVVGPDGAPVEGVLLTAWPTGRAVGDDGPSSEHPSDRSDAQGKFRLRRLGAFRYRVTAVPPSRFVRENVVEFESGAKDVSVTLRTGASPSILVLDPDGRPVRGVEVRAAPARFERVHGVEVPMTVPLAADATTDAEGKARLLGLDPAVPYTLSTYFSSLQLAALPFTEQRWLPVDRTIRLDRSYRLAGIVRDRAGRPVPAAMVSWLSQPPNGWAGDRAKEDGTFAFTGLPAGETRLQVMLGGPGDYGADPVEFPARAGDEHVELVIDVGLTLEIHVAGWPTEEKALGYAIPAILWRRGEAGGRAWRALVYPNGVATLRGLAPGPDFELVVRSLPDGRTAHRTGVRPDAGTLDLGLVAGGTVEGRLSLPSGATQATVTLSIPGGSYLSQGTVDPDGRFVVHGVPDGVWEIRANAQMPGETDGRPNFATGTASASPGQTVEIVLKPQ